MWVRRFRGARRCHPGEESAEQCVESDDDDRGRDSSWNAESLEAVYSARYGKSEQHSEEDGEKEYVRVPEQLERDVEKDRERRCPKHISTLPPHGPAPPLVVYGWRSACVGRERSVCGPGRALGRRRWD
jgi:hypothetical protein